MSEKAGTLRDDRLESGLLVQHWNEDDVLGIRHMVHVARTQLDEMNKKASARELSLAITKLDEARLWLNDLLVRMYQ